MKLYKVCQYSVIYKVIADYIDSDSCCVLRSRTHRNQAVKGFLWVYFRPWPMCLGQNKSSKSDLFLPLFEGKQSRDI